MRLDDKAPSLSVLNARFRYDPDTGYIFARKSGGRRKSGDRVGYADNLGYWKVFLCGGWVMSHRLAWLLTYGCWPSGEIDHINGDPSDNRISNLREATRSQNVMNTKRGNGVCWHKNKKKWQVIVTANGKKHYIGMFDCRDEAEKKAIAAKKKFQGEFAFPNRARLQPPTPKPQQEGWDI